MSYKVDLRIYDISRGMAPTMSMMFLNKRIDGVWHTGVEVHGTEYFYAGGIVSLPAGEFEQQYDLQICKVLELGYTTMSKDNFVRELVNMRPHFTEKTYDLIKWNCNHFTNECVKILLPELGGIPDTYLKQHEEVMETPFGKILIGFLKAAQEKIQSTMNIAQASLFNNKSSDSANVEYPQNIEYPEQFRTLTNMGFTDALQVNKVLKAVAGNINAALDRLAKE